MLELRLPVVSSAVFTAAADDDAAEIYIDHYPAMAKKELHRIAKEAAEQWELNAIILIHRYGSVVPGEAIAFISVAARSAGHAQEGSVFSLQSTREYAAFWCKNIYFGPIE